MIPGRHPRTPLDVPAGIFVPKLGTIRPSPFARKSPAVLPCFAPVPANMNIMSRLAPIAADIEAHVAPEVPARGGADDAAAARPNRAMVVACLVNDHAGHDQCLGP